MTKKELAELTGYSYRRLYDIDKQLPPSMKLFIPCEDGGCDAAAFVRNWVRYNVDTQSAESAGSESLDDARAAHEIVKKRKTELQVAMLEGRMADMSDVRLAWMNVANTVKQHILNMPGKLAPAIAGIEDVNVIRAMIQR